MYDSETADVELCVILLSTAHKYGQYSDLKTTVRRRRPPTKRRENGSYFVKNAPVFARKPVVSATDQAGKSEGPRRCNATKSILLQLRPSIELRDSRTTTRGPTLQTRNPQLSVVLCVNTNHPAEGIGVFTFIDRTGNRSPRLRQ